MKSSDGILVSFLIVGCLLGTFVSSQNLDQKPGVRRYRQAQSQPQNQGRPSRLQERSDTKSSSSWPSSESLWSDIPKSDNFDLRNWRSWHQDGDGDEEGQVDSAQLQKQPFKRNIAPPSQENFNFNSNQVNPEFYPSAPISNPNFGPKQNTYNSQPQPQTYQQGEGQQPFSNYKVNYNEGDDKPFHSNYNGEANFKKSQTEGGAPYQQHSSYPATSFTPSFGGAGFPTSIDYNAEPQPQDASGFYGGEENGEAGERDQPDFGFTGHFGDPTDKDGRIKSGVSQSYSTYTGPDGKSNGFFVKDHNTGGPQPEQIKQQIQSSISNAQGNINPGVRGFSGNQQRPSFQENEVKGFSNQRPSFDDNEDEEEDSSSFGTPPQLSKFGPPTTDFSDTDRFKRGSHTQEKFHQNNKKTGGHDTSKTFRKPLPKIQYDKQDPDTETKTYDSGPYSVVKTFKGGYSSDDKDAHLRPPPTYNYELIDDEDGEGKFEQPQESEKYRKTSAKSEPEEDYYVPKGQEEKVRPKYEEMPYEDRWRSRQDRKIGEKEGNREEEEVEGEGDGEGEGEEEQRQPEEEEEEEEEPVVRTNKQVAKNPDKRQRQVRQKSASHVQQKKKPAQRKRQLEVDSEDESKIAPTWIWDPSKFQILS